MPAQTSRLVELDALRGLAAVAVMLFHLTLWDYNPAMARYWFQAGRYGVELFFIISGFVIFMTVSNTATLRNFAASRFARLYPAYWAAMAITASIAGGLERRPIPPISLLANLTMTPGWFGIAGVDNAYWTLAIELAFYALIAIVLTVGLLNRIEAICIALLAAAGLLRLLGAPPTGLIAYGGFFVIGICLFRLRTIDDQRFTLATLVLAVSYAAWGDPVSARSPSVLDHLGVTAGLTLLVFLGVNQHLRFLRWRCLTLLGSISYPLYLIHQRFGTDLRNLLFYVGLPGPLALAGAIAGSVIMAICIHIGIEQPARRALRPRLGGIGTSTRGAAQPHAAGI